MIMNKKLVTLFLTFSVLLFYINSLSAQDFTKVKGGAIDIATHPKNGKVYVVGSSSKEIFYYNKSTNTFKPFLKEADAKRISVSSDNTVWIVRQDKKVARSQGNNWEVVKPISYSSDISVDSRNNPWSCFAINGKVLKYEDNNWNHDKTYGSGADKISAYHRADLWVIKKDQSLHHYFKNKWEKLPEKAIDIEIDRANREVYIVGTSNRIYKWKNSTKEWKEIAGTRSDVVSVAVHDREVWCTTTNNDIYFKQFKESDEPVFHFKASRKKVVVLVHGITASANYKNGINNGVNTNRYPQYYWGFDFIRTIMGVKKGEKIALTAPQSYNLPNYDIVDYLWGNHRYAITMRQDRNSEVKYAYVLKHRNAQTDVMCTYRDGGQGLMDQTKATINQVYDSYQSYYGYLPPDEQPMICLLAHSFGGIVCRTILSNPAEADKHNVKLTEEERRRADFIRNRTVWLTTLATPHLGSPLPKVAQQQDKLISGWIKGFDDLGSEPDVKLLENLRRDWIDGRKLCLQDILDYDYYQSRWLKPQNAKRTNGELVPIYTLTGSTPGHIFFLHPRALLSPFDNSINDIKTYYEEEKEKRGKYKIGPDSDQLFMLDRLNAGNITGPNYWPAVYPGGKIGDKFTINAISAADVTIGPSVIMQPDGRFDSDGFVGFHSGHGFKMDGTNIESFSGRNKGSWYRIYGEDYGSFHPWDLDNHRSICYNTGTSAFIGNHLLKKGHLAKKDKFSSWYENSPNVTLPNKKVKLKITGLENLVGEDFGSEGYKVRVKIGNGDFQTSGVIKEKQVIDRGNFQSGKSYVWYFAKGVSNATVVPIIIQVINVRTGAISDQICSGSASPYLEEVVLYVDVQNNKIYGEIEGPTGSSNHTITGSSKSKRPVKLKFRVELESM